MAKQSEFENSDRTMGFDLSDLLEVLEKYGVRSAADLEEQLAARFEIVDGPQPEVVEVSDEERVSRVSVLILQSIKALCELVRIPRTDWGKYFGQIWPVILEDQAKWNVVDVEERFAVVYSQETGSQLN